MLVAAVDSATLTLSCALVEIDGGGAVRLVADRTDRAPPKAATSGPAGGHSVRLPGALADLLAADGRQLRDVEAYAIGLGPGSFTGLRIGLATWKGLAYANRRPIAGVSSLAAMALDAAAAAQEGALLVPLLDARKGEVYAGFYRAVAGGAEAAAPDAALSPGALAERVAVLEPARERRHGFGEGHAAFPALAEALPLLAAGPATPSAMAVARLAAPRLRGAAYDAQALFALEPQYVRASEAEIRFPHGLGPDAKR